MAQKILALNAEIRQEIGKKAKTLLLKARIPAVLYGGGQENTILTVEAVPFQKIFHEAGESSLVDLVISDGQRVKTLIHDVQYSPSTNKVIHVDFFRVNMKEKLTATIQLQFEGESPAVKELSGTLVKSIDQLEVRCLPSDLIAHITVDVSVLKTFDDAVKIKDIDLPHGLELMHHDADDVVALVTPPISEEELKKLEQASSSENMPAEPVVEKKGKSEEGQ